MKKIELNIIGMTCASCALLNEKQINHLDGIEKVNVNIATNKANIEFDENKLQIEDIIKVIQDTWYDAKLVDTNNENLEKDYQKNIDKVWKRFVLSAVFGLPVMSMMFQNISIGTNVAWVDILMWIYALLSACVVFIFWYHFHKSALIQLKKFRFNMDSLVSLGTLTAFFYSLWAMFNWMHVYFEAAVAIVTLINLGKYLEEKSKGKAWEALWKLLELGVKDATVLIDKKEQKISIDKIWLGDILVVKAWEKIAVDGEIIYWEASVDESMITGESIPAIKKLKDKVYGATINLDSILHIQVTQIWNETMLAQIINMVEEAQWSKAPIQKLVDKIAWIFVPVIISISILTFIVWFILTKDMASSIIPAVAVLVIACPCALWLATPTAIMVGTGLWAKKWILIKNGETLEKSNDIDVVVFDKTGTLTTWKLKVTDIDSFDLNEDEVVKMAYSLWKSSNHPLSQAVTNYGEEQKIDTIKINDFQEIRGKWIRGYSTENRVELILWNQKMMEEYDVNIEEKQKKLMEKIASKWKTPLILAHDKKIVWVISVMDTPKEDAKIAISQIEAMWIKTVMLSWDNKKTVNKIGKDLWIGKIIWGLLPEDKIEEIKKLQKAWKKVAFVWDGINDAPALAQADLGIAMGTGTDVAIQTWNIVLMKWSPSKVATAIKLSQTTFRTIKQNLFWAFIYNIIWIPLAAFAMLNPIFASFAMSMSSVSVILNSLRIKNKF